MWKSLNEPRTIIVSNAETRHQQRLKPNIGKVRRTLNDGMYIIGLILSAIGFFSIIAANVFTNITHEKLLIFMGARNTLLSPFTYFIIFVIATHLIIIARILNRGSSAVNHENMWDLLCLTDINARQLIMGKWWGVIQSNAREVWRFIPLRIGGIVILGIISYSVWTQQPQPEPTPPPILMLMLASALIVILTWIQIGFAAAVGVCASALVKHARYAVTASFTLYTFISCALIIGVLIPIITINNQSYKFGASMNTIDAKNLSLLFSELPYTMGLPFVDNGTLVLARMLNFHYEFSRYNYISHDIINVSRLMGLGFYIIVIPLITIALLKIAQKLVIRKGISSPSANP